MSKRGTSKSPLLSSSTTSRITMEKLCRVCAGTGLYDINSRIPFFVHSSPHEFNQWTKTIAVLVEDITGCVIAKNDGLPQKICSVCISYLKHATIFRQQCIDNIQNLKTAKELNIPKNDSPDSPGTGNNGKFFKSNVKVANSNMDVQAHEQIKHELDLFFGDHNIQEDDEDDEDDEEDDGDDEDAEQPILNGIVANGKADTVKSAIHNFFNYSERTFEEDDLSKFDGIGISEPDDHKERKCYACKRIFLLNDSFEDHMKECIEAKLFSFITDCHQLAIIKKHKAISAQEFIRRMIFAVKSIVKSLAMCYRVLSPPAVNMNNMMVGTAIAREKTVPKQLFNDMDIMRPPPELTAQPPARLQAIPATTFAPKPDKNFPKIRNFAAKCPSCKQVFHSIQALEMHNQQLHNPRRGIYGRKDQTPTSVSSSDNASNASNPLRGSLNLEDYATEGIVDVMRLRQRSPNVKNIRVSKDYNSRGGL